MVNFSTHLSARFSTRAHAPAVSRRGFLGACGALGTLGALGVLAAAGTAGRRAALAESASTDEGSQADGIDGADADSSTDGATASSAPAQVEGAVFTEGSRTDRGFTVDDALETGGRTLHFSLHVPDSYDGSRPFALYIACPGWEGLYFQGVGANLQEDFPFVANSYVPDMIVASPQLDDWHETSAEDVIALTEWLLQAFSIDPSRVYLSGNSGGGETISTVLGMRPELYRRALHTISQWDGDVDVLAEARVPVYLAIGEHDDYYGSAPDERAYQKICDAYRERGLAEDEISELVTLDVKPTSYFTERGLAENASQHMGGGALFPHDEQIMGWLFEGDPDARRDGQADDSR